MFLTREGDVALIRMRRGKVNAISAELLGELSNLLSQLGGARAAVITGEGSAFSAGLDLPSLIDLDRATMRGFIGRFSEVILRLVELPIPLVAAVNRHAIPGGCVLALQADVRLAADKDARLGLNEVQLGIGLPAAALGPLRGSAPAASPPSLPLPGPRFHPAQALPGLLL